MLPEISRRCASCGAAVRAGARFCPQCGQVVAGAEAQSRAAQPSVEGPSDARGGAERAGSAGGSTGGDAADGQRRAGGASDDAAPVNNNVAPVTRDAEAPGEWAKPTREFSAFVELLAADEPRGGGGPRAGSQEGATPPVAPGARDGGAASATTSADAGDVADAGDFANAGDVKGAVGVAGVGDDARVAADDMRGRVARVREGARERVGRMRDDALVALEETPDDSGLRFVVVAAVLFVLFLFFLFLSTTVLR